MARHNAELFGVADRITLMHCDSLQLIPSIGADTAFLAPPWGRPEYARRALLTFECFSPDGNELMRIACGCFRDLVLQLPRNFDGNEFRRFHGALSLSQDCLGDELLSYTDVVRVK